MPTTATELIAHIPTRFHETHRRELPSIVARARALEGKGATPTLADEFDVMAKALEMHMLKEERAPDVLTPGRVKSLLQ